MINLDEWKSYSWDRPEWKEKNLLLQPSFTNEFKELIKTTKYQCRGMKIVKIKKF